MLSSLLPGALSSEHIGYLVIAGIAAAFVGFVFNLQAQNARLKAEVAEERQRAAALSDSLKKTAEYETDGGQARTIWSRALFPTTNPDTLGPKQIEEDVKSKTEAEVDPDAETASGQSAAAGSTESKRFEHRIEPDLLDRYDLEMDLTVFAPGDRIEYDLSVDARAFGVSVYQTENKHGVRSVSLDAPSAVGIRSVRGQVAQPKQRGGKTRHNWELRLPVQVTTGGTRFGATFNRYVGIHESKTTSVRAFVGAGAFYGITSEVSSTPVASSGLSVSF